MSGIAPHGATQHAQQPPCGAGAGTCLPLDGSHVDAAHGAELEGGASIVTEQHNADAVLGGHQVEDALHHLFGHIHLGDVQLCSAGKQRDSAEARQAVKLRAPVFALRTSQVLSVCAGERAQDLSTLAPPQQATQRHSPAAVRFFCSPNWS